MRPTEKPKTEPTVDVPMKISAQSYRTFVVFDLLYRQKRWRRPLVFAAILLGSAGICLTQLGKQRGVGLLAAVLALVGLGLPAAYFGMFFHSLSRQCRVLAKAGPTLAYRLRLTGEGLDVWMPGEMDRPQPPQHFDWAALYKVYRTPDALYFYVQANKSFLLPADQLGARAEAAYTLAKRCPQYQEVRVR